MGDERKIEKSSENVQDLVEQSKLVFLRELSTEFQERQAQYNLEEEFAKTKRNRSLLVPMVVVGIVLFFVAGAVGITLYIENRSKDVQVGVHAFEDVNLRDVLDAAKRNEQEMEAARRELENLLALQESEIGQARRAFERESEIITASVSLSEEEKARRIAAARAALGRQTDRIRKAYQPKIEEKEAEIEDIQKQMEAYDTRQVQRAKEQEEILNNQRKLFEFELAQTKAAYEKELKDLNIRYTREIEELKKYQQELIAVLKANHAREIANLILKYNPKAVSDPVVPLIQAPIDPGVVEARLPGFDRSLMTAEGIVDPNTLVHLGEKLQEQDRILKELKKIPFENIVPQIIAQIEAREKEVALIYERVISLLDQGLRSKNLIIQNQKGTIEGLETQVSNQQALLDRYAYAVEQFFVQTREQGFVLDARDPKDILVAVNKLRKVSSGSVARVFRRDDEYIGRIHYQVEGSHSYWALLDLEDVQNPIRPFDKILVEEQ